MITVQKPGDAGGMPARVVFFLFFNMLNRRLKYDAWKRTAQAGFLGLDFYRCRFSSRRKGSGLFQSAGGAAFRGRPGRTSAVLNADISSSRRLFCFAFSRLPKWRAFREAGKHARRFFLFFSFFFFSLFFWGFLFLYTHAYFLSVLFVHTWVFFVYLKLPFYFHSRLPKSTLLFFFFFLEMYTLLYTYRLCFVSSPLYTQAHLLYLLVVRIRPTPFLFFMYTQVCRPLPFFVYTLLCCFFFFFLDAFA